MKVIIRRFLEFFIIEALLSSILTFLFKFVAEPLTNAVLLATALGIVIFVIVQIKMLRSCYLDLRSPFLYFAINLTANTMIIILNFIMVFILKPTVYTYFYFITKILYFSNPNIDSFLSALIFHIFMFIVIIIAPIGLDKNLIQMDLFDELDVTENYGMTEDYVITEAEGEADETQ